MQVLAGYVYVTLPVMMKNATIHKSKRSDCPISCSLDLIGDKWSLLIIRDMLFFGKNTYNEFLVSPEGISTNILSDRLLKLAEAGFITFSGTEKRKKYKPTKMGLDVKPILASIKVFGLKHLQNIKKNGKPS
jgi:DNA-binding HxlR family transcriptional regulator